MLLKTGTNKGFTLIELLVVVTIISLLSSIVMASLNSARAKARDTTRKAEMKQLQNALELYYNANGSYPSTGGTWYSSEPDSGIFSNNNGNWIPGLATTYISSLPRDPLGGTSSNPVCSPNGYKREFLYRSDTGSNYKILAHCAPETTLSSSDPFVDPLRSTYAFYVTNKNDPMPGGCAYTDGTLLAQYPICW